IQPAQSGPSTRSAIAEVGHSSDTKTSSAAPVAVRSSRPTTAGSTPATDNAGARWLCIGRLLGQRPAGVVAMPPRDASLSGSLSAMTSSVSAEGDLRAGPPDWFHEALGAPVEIGSVTVDGTAISYRAFGRAGGGGIVLVHGGAAHARWWDHIA